MIMIVIFPQLARSSFVMFVFVKFVVTIRPKMTTGAAVYLVVSDKFGFHKFSGTMGV